MTHVHTPRRRRLLERARLGVPDLGPVDLTQRYPDSASAMTVYRLRTQNAAITGAASGFQRRDASCLQLP
jgi:hypothetical protein